MELHLLIALLEICELELQIRHARLRRHRPLLRRRTLPTFSLDLLLQLHVLFGHQLPCRLDLAQLLLSCERLLGQLMHARARLVQLLLKRPLLLLLLLFVLVLGVRHRVRHSTLLAILARHSTQTQLLLIVCMHRVHLFLHRGQSCLQPLHLSKAKDARARTRRRTEVRAGERMKAGDVKMKGARAASGTARAATQSVCMHGSPHLLSVCVQLSLHVGTRVLERRLRCRDR